MEPAAAVRDIQRTLDEGWRELVRVSAAHPRRAAAVAAYGYAFLIALALLVAAARDGGDTRAVAAPPGAAPAPAPARTAEPAATHAPQPAAPKPEQATPERASRPAPAASEPEPRSVRRPAPDTRPYAVRGGDTLGGIAGVHGTTVERLLALNRGIDPYALMRGQVLRVPDGPRPAAPGVDERSTPGGTYTAGKGDTLWEIAAERGVGVAEILALNPGVDADALVPGTELTLP